MARGVVVVGAGGHAREVLDVIDAINDAGSARDAVEVVAVLADPLPEPEQFAAYDIGPDRLGPVSALRDQPASVGYVIGIGASDARARIDREHLGERDCPVLIHPDTFLGRRRVEFGPGTVLFAQVGLTNHITLGRHVHVNRGSTVGHDSVLGDYVTVSPHTCISGNVTAEDEVFFGTASVANPGVRIGAGATVGSGGVVVRDVEPGLTVVGIPARVR